MRHNPVDVLPATSLPMLLSVRGCARPDPAATKQLPPPAQRPPLSDFPAIETPVAQKHWRSQPDFAPSAAPLRSRCWREAAPAVLAVLTCESTPPAGLRILARPGTTGPMRIPRQARLPRLLP